MTVESLYKSFALLTKKQWLVAVLIGLLGVIWTVWRDSSGQPEQLAALNAGKEAVCQPSPGRGPEMVIIPAGTFMMGSPDSDQVRDDEIPQHAVSIAYPFAIGRCEVSFAEYQMFVEATGRKQPEDYGWGRDMRPVINVSWEDAAAYADWLSIVTNRRYRLPTEAEWEYAARAGSETIYWWGDEIGVNNANCEGCGSLSYNGQTAPIASYKANGFGVYDTAGNVYEWVQDCWHDNYQDAPNDGRAWESANDGDCGRRVIRGGSWFDGPGGVRSAFRGWNPPGLRLNDLGFRLAQDIN